MTIVGVYRPVDTADPFWFNQPYFVATPSIGEKADLVDSIYVDRSEFTGLIGPDYVEADFDYPLTPSAVRLDTMAAERAAVTHVLAGYPKGASVSATSGLVGVLASTDHERHLADVSTLLVTLQLALLAWLVLFQIVSDAIETRGNEIAMAKLRGLSPAATIRFGLGETVLLLLLAIPIGVLVALGATHLLADSALVDGVPVVLPWSSLLTALIAFAGGLVAAAAAGYRTLTRSVLDQWRRTERSPGGNGVTLAADVVVAAAAVTGLILLSTEHHTASSGNPATLLAPGLLVTAVGLLGVRLLPLLCRWLARLSRASRHISVFLATRQVARRPVGLRLAALLAVAVGLATFAVAGESVATSNRSARAQAELGAARVATVQFDSNVNPVAAVAKADPRGTWAMAAATWLPDGGNSVTGTVLGVDSSRFVGIGYKAAGGPSPADVAHIIGASTVPAITTTASQMRLHVTAMNLTGDKAPYAEVNLRTPGAAYFTSTRPTCTTAARPSPCRCPARWGAPCWGSPGTGPSTPPILKAERSP